MKKEIKEKYCQRCYNNFYNGNNDLGVKKCWSLKDAKVVKKGVYFSSSQIEPTIIKTLDCFRPNR